MLQQHSEPAPTAKALLTTTMAFSLSRIISVSAFEPLGDLRHMPTLEARDFKFVLRGLPRAVAVGQR